MNSKERFYACVDYRHPDRPPCDFRAVWQIINGLMDYYGESSYEALMIRLGTDFRFIAPRYVGPELKIHEDGSVEGLWGQRSKISGSGNGTFNETVYLPYADVTDVAELDAFRFPSADWFDYSHVSEDADRFEKYIVTAGYIGASNSGDSPGYGVSPPCAPDFINGMARIRGTEQILIDIALEDPVFIELVNRKHRLSMEIYENILTAGKGKIDVLYLADDLGNQESLMISPLKFDRLFAEKYRELFALAHRHNAKAMMHCCGSVRRLIPRLIDLGLDILDVLQPKAAGMEIEELKKYFHKKIVFAGSMCIQETLPFGSKEDVRAEIFKRRSLFSDGGLIIAPSNNLQTDTSIENIIAMYDAIKETI